MRPTLTPKLFQQRQMDATPAAHLNPTLVLGPFSRLVNRITPVFSKGRRMPPLRVFLVAALLAGSSDADAGSTTSVCANEVCTGAGAEVCPAMEDALLCHRRHCMYWDFCEFATTPLAVRPVSCVWTRPSNQPRHRRACCCVCPPHVCHATPPANSNTPVHTRRPDGVFAGAPAALGPPGVSERVRAVWSLDGGVERSCARVAPGAGGAGGAAVVFVDLSHFVNY